MKLDNLPSYVDPSLNLELIRTECLAMAKKRALISAGVSTIPIPFFDVVVDAGILTELLPEISAKFGLAPEPEAMFDFETRDVDWGEVRSRGLTFAGLVTQRGIVRGTIQGFGMRLITRQVVKFIPLGGSIVAATMGYTVFKRIASDHVDKCYKAALSIQSVSVSIEGTALTLTETITDITPVAASKPAPRPRKPAAAKTAPEKAAPATAAKAKNAAKPTAAKPAAPKAAPAKAPAAKTTAPKATAAKATATKAAPAAPDSAPKAPAKRAAKKPTPPAES